MANLFHLLGGKVQYIVQNNLLSIRYDGVEMRFLSWLVPLALAASAQTLTISGLPVTLDENEEASVSVTFICPACSTDSYIRGVFYPSGTGYFGFTQNNGGSWINAPGAECTEYFKIAKEDVIREGSWSGILRIKPDSESASFSGPGEYLFKVGRYTPSCSSASVWSNEMTVAISGPTTTPTFVPTIEPTHTTTPQPTHTPVPTNTLIPTSSAAPTRKKIAILNNPSGILGLQHQATKESEVRNNSWDLQSATPSVKPRSPLIFSLLLVGIGTALLSTAVALKQTDIWKKLHESSTGHR